MKKIFLILIFLLFIQNIYACQTTSDNNAVEVLLNKEDIKFDLSSLRSGENIIMNGNQYILQSNLDKAALIIQKSSLCEKCISVRIQVPVETTTEKIPYFSFTSSLLGTVFDFNKENLFYKDWNIQLGTSNINLISDKMTINVNFVNNNYEFVYEIYKSFSDCDICSGKCVKSRFGDACIDIQTTKEISDVLMHLGLINRPEQIFYSYKVIGNGEKLITDLISTVDTSDLNFNNALEADLKWLKLQKIITLSDEDIQNIKALAEKGYAGNNKLILYDNGWKYNFQVKNVTLSNELNCKDFSRTLVPTKLPVLKRINVFSPYYMIPIITSLILLIILIILIFTARYVCNKRDCNITEPQEK